MALTRPLMMQASGADAAFPYSALQHRALVAAMLSEGVVGDLDLRATQRAAGANFTVDVAAGASVVVGDSVAGQGSYLAVNDAPITGVVIPAAPASGSLTHRVVLRIRDRAHDGSLAAGIYDAVIEVLADTGTGTPALPASAITLATVNVTSTTTSITNANITDGRVRSSPSGPKAVRYGPGTSVAVTNAVGPVTLVELALPALGYPTSVMVTAMLGYSKSDTSQFEIGINRDFGAGLSRHNTVLMGGSATIPYTFDLPAYTATTVICYATRVTGTGTITTLSNTLLNRLDILRVPA